MTLCHCVDKIILGSNSLITSFINQTFKSNGDSQAALESDSRHRILPIISEREVGRQWTYRDVYIYCIYEYHRE